MNLTYRIYRPEKAVASMFVIHGMQEHKDRYHAFAQYLKEHGIGVVIYDLPGHRGNREDLGWFGEKDGYRNLVLSGVEIAELTEREFPGVPMYCFGHSMGSLIARNFLQKYSGMISGMILSGAPCYNTAAPAGRVLVRTLSLLKGEKGHSKVLDDMVTGAFNRTIKDPETPVDWISYDRENVKAFLEDEWCGFPFTIQGYGDLLDLVIRMHDPKLYHVNNPDLPIYFMAGADDPCTGGQAGLTDSIGILEKAGYRNIEKKTWPHMRHEILNEGDRQSVYEDVVRWMEEKLNENVPN